MDKTKMLAFKMHDIKKEMPEDNGHRYSVFVLIDWTPDPNFSPLTYWAVRTVSEGRIGTGFGSRWIDETEKVKYWAYMPDAEEQLEVWKDE